MTSNIGALPAIDVHGHYGQYVRSETDPLKQRFMSIDPTAVMAVAKVVNVQYCKVSYRLPYRNPETTSGCERENSSGLPPSNRGQENDHATLDKKRRSIMACSGKLHTCLAS